MVNRAVIGGLLVCVFDKNNRIILLDTSHPIRFCGKTIPNSLIIKKGMFIPDGEFKKCGIFSFLLIGHRTRVPGL